MPCKTSFSFWDFSLSSSSKWGVILKIKSLQRILQEIFSLFCLIPPIHSLKAKVREFVLARDASNSLEFTQHGSHEDGHHVLNGEGFVSAFGFFYLLHIPVLPPQPCPGPSPISFLSVSLIFSNFILLYIYKYYFSWAFRTWPLVSLASITRGLVNLSLISAISRSPLFKIQATSASYLHFIIIKYLIFIYLR